MKDNIELKYRSTINPLAVGISLILYVVMIILIITKNPDDKPWVLPVMLSVVVFIIALDILKYVSYKYYFENKGLVIIHRKRKFLLPYKDIKYYEVDSHETRGVIYGYGVRRILIAIGKGIDEIYLITPANEDKFIELLEKKINMAKRNTR